MSRGVSVYWIIVSVAVAFPLGVVAGREWLKYEIRTGLQDAFGAFSGAFGLSEVEERGGPDSTPSATPPKDPPPTWKVSRETSAIDDTETVVLTLQSDEKVSVWPGLPQRPVLVLRCSERTTEAYVSAGFVVQDEPVAVRLDREPASKTRVTLATSRDAVFFRSAIPFIRTLEGRERLTIQLNPGLSAPVTASFTLTGLSDVLPELKRACNWK